MSRLRFLGSLVAGRLSSRRICAGSARRLVHHQSSNLADDSGRSRRRFSVRSASIVTAVALSSALVGGTLYFKHDAKTPPTAGKKRPDLHTPALSPPATTTPEEEVAADEEDPAKEAAMKTKFEEWMVEYGRTYESEEEKAMRYRNFKRTVEFCEKANARRLRSGDATFGANGLADLTEEEWRPRRGRERESHRDTMYVRAVNWWIRRGCD